jgi:hypothetical protein
VQVEHQLGPQKLGDSHCEHEEIRHAVYLDEPILPPKVQETDLHGGLAKKHPVLEKVAHDPRPPAVQPNAMHGDGAGLLVRDTIAVVSSDDVDLVPLGGQSRDFLSKATTRRVIGLSNHTAALHTRIQG